MPYNRSMRAWCLATTLVVPALSWGQADYPGALWNAAHSGNFSVASRPTSTPIQYVVIHIMEGSYAGSISWFKNPASNVSAHYLLRSSDGQITQMVREKDIAYHAGNWTYNTRSVGIEHEGYGNNPNWLTPEMYKASSSLTRYLTRKYNIPRNRTYIIGHKEVPGVATACPGTYWDWNAYITMVQLDGAFASAEVPTDMAPGQSIDAVVRFQNTGDLAWMRTLGPGRVRLGTQLPADRTSPFYAAAYWDTPNRPATVFAETAPGSQGEFRFRLKAPLTSGQYSESFQMRREDGNWFGPLLTFNINVAPADRPLDNTSPNFFSKGGWSTGTTAAGKYGADYRFANTAPNNISYAGWLLGVPVTGNYDVYAWWSQGTNRSDQAKITIDHRWGTWSGTVDQTTAGGQWVLLGRHSFLTGTGLVKFHASAPSGRVVIADAVRYVGPY